MSEADRPIFFDLDRESGQATATTYASMRASLLTQHPIPPTVPEEIRAMLFAAMEYVALAYERANTGRRRLYNLLTNDAFLKGVLALELALRHYLRRGKRATLETLIADGTKQGMLPSAEPYAALWTELRQNRNDLVHANAGHPDWGAQVGAWVGLITGAISGMAPDQTRDGGRPESGESGADPAASENGGDNGANSALCSTTD